MSDDTEYEQDRKESHDPERRAHDVREDEKPPHW